MSYEKGVDHDGLLEEFKEMSDWSGNCGTCGAPARTRKPEGGIRFDSGVTEDDVRQLRFIATSDEWVGIREFATSLADRIEALLPPKAYRIEAGGHVDSDGGLTLP